MSITKALLTFVLLSISTASFATRIDRSDVYIPNIDFTEQHTTTGEPFDVYLVKISSKNGCCSANIRVHANGAEPTTAKFGVDGAVFDVEINQINTSYSFSALKTNLLTHEKESAEFSGIKIGKSIGFSLDGYDATVTSELSAH